MPSVFNVTAPLEIVKWFVSKLAIPLLVVVASSALIAPLDISMPSPALKCARTWSCICYDTFTTVVC